jgi:ribosomal protein S18 acetylase RimI-like enzyme
MNYGKCEINKHNLNDIANLIYQTEPDLTRLFFGKNKTKAIKRLIKLIKNKSNTFSYKHIFIANENEKVYGILLGSTGKEIDRNKERYEILKSIDFLGSLRLHFYDTLIVNRIFTTEIKPEDFYIHVLHVEKTHQSQGIGKNLLKNIEKIVKEKNCDRITLDVSKENTNAIKFYKKIGFTIYDEVNYRLALTEINVYKMQLLI